MPGFFIGQGINGPPLGSILFGKNAFRTNWMLFTLYAFFQKLLRLSFQTATYRMCHGDSWSKTYFFKYR